ncbi:GGDEF domain-containing protein [Pleionea sediminis]|uniref:GGDEF domain-containing protein n=1 Tax=Pleionea sediminis TaxID=2569479 RepID=UPI0011854CF1|nr:GGDEF domain-containing protein [Pleionea sediminis]
MVNILKLITLLLISGLALFSFNTSATENFTLEEVDNVESLPASFFDLTSAEKVAWLTSRIESEKSPAQKYSYQRTLVIELYAQSRYKEAEAQCRAFKPLKADLFLRSYCIEATYLDINDIRQKMLGLIDEARKANKNDMVAELLSKLAWQQSKNGEVVAAFTHYSEALDIVSPDNLDLVNSIMFDTASSYIAHGNEQYVDKGIELLEKISLSTEKELLKEQVPERKHFLTWYVQLSHFNAGLAYFLHKHDYEMALRVFDRVNHLDNSIGFNSLSYSAYAASILGKFNRAKKYLSEVNDRKDDSPIVETYLTCYRKLAEQFWNTEVDLSACLNLSGDTALEVKVDLFKRLSDNPKSEIATYGLRKLKELYVEVLEPQLRSQLTHAASNAEVTRLEKESLLTSRLVKQQMELQKETNAKHATQRKYFIAVFFVLVFFILFVFSQLRQKRRLAQQYEKLSLVDSLTKLGNRRYLEQHIEREFLFVKRAIESGKNISLGIFLFDIDHFKKINDDYGHLVGDKILQEISQRIGEITRGTDILARWGGEEFIYVARLEQPELKYELANRILLAINSKPFDITNSDQPLNVTCTIGIVEFPLLSCEKDIEWNRLISLADAALYHGKSIGRNCWVATNNFYITNEEQLSELLNTPFETLIQQNALLIRTSFDQS